jgi:hypothetical protein
MRIFSDSKVSGFLKEVTIEQRIHFLNTWNKRRDHREKIYISYDSTNKISQAGDIDMVELGHSKENGETDIFKYQFLIFSSQFLKDGTGQSPCPGITSNTRVDE